MAGQAERDDRLRGGFYAIPVSLPKSDHIGMIRVDWLDRLGLQVPTTVEELYQVARAFKDELGIYPISSSPSHTAGFFWLNYLFYAFGGGYWRTAPGQITDDGEMALCLMHALAGQERFSVERVAQQYLRWYQSLPFDIGRTTRTGLSGGLNQPAGGIHTGMWNETECSSQRSNANGGLMRIAPLGVWGWRPPEEDLVDAACKDNRRTHPNPACQHSSTLYCLAIRHLMLNPEDGEGAFETAGLWTERLGSADVRGWFYLAETNEDAGYHPSAGFVKYGFGHSFRHLKNIGS